MSNARKPDSDRKSLSGAQKFQLYKLLEQEYTSSGMLDPIFANHASEKLGFPVVTSNIKYARDQLGIQANWGAGSNAKPVPQVLLDRIMKLENAVANLQRQVETHLFARKLP